MLGYFFASPIPPCLRGGGSSPEGPEESIKYKKSFRKKRNTLKNLKSAEFLAAPGGGSERAQKLDKTKNSSNVKFLPRNTLKILKIAK